MSDFTLQVSPDLLMEKYREIQRMDDQIAAATGDRSASKTVIANRFAKEQTETVEKLVTQLSGILENQTIEVQAGIYRGLTQGLKTKFYKDIDEFLENEAKTAEANKPTGEDAVAVDVASTLESRKGLLTEYNALRNILALYGESVPAIKDALASIPAPKKMTGARGKRAMSKFQFAVDGVKLSADENSLSKVAEILGFVDRTEEKTTNKRDGSTETKDVTVTARSQLTAVLAGMGLNAQTPPETWSYEVNGRTVSGSPLPVASSDDDEDDEKDEDSIEETE